MDIRMPDGDGLWATEQIVANPPLAGTHIVIVTTFELDEYVGAGDPRRRERLPGQRHRAGRADPRRARRRRRGCPAQPGVTKRLLERVAGTLHEPPDTARLAALTDREREVLGLVGQGLTNDEIGRALFLSPLTAKTHVSRIMSKLLARDRVQLVVVAYETGLVTAGQPE